MPGRRSQCRVPDGFSQVFVAPHACRIVPPAPRIPSAPNNRTKAAPTAWKRGERRIQLRVPIPKYLSLDVKATQRCRYSVVCAGRLSRHHYQRPSGLLQEPPHHGRIRGKLRSQLP